MKLFVGHPSDDGELTIDTDVGAYCVQLHRNGEFIPIIMDDLLPMRKKDKWTNENRGMAGAHNRECNGLWVSLVEKAFAKYFGSYAALQRGYIHHALRDLTGFETEWIPLSSASRGIGKKSLWEDLVRFKKNGYILGAGTGDSKLVDKENQNIGIVFNSEYTIYNLVSVDGQQLLKLRNPPGDHDEWKGDWGDKSSLWTRKLRGKLNFTDADDNTFYMSFDDFCNVFRNLYVCRYYNPKRWMEEVLPGLWKKSDLAEFESHEMLNQFMEAESEAGEKLQVDNEAMNRKRAKARIDSAGGLPTNQNPTCVLENNPYYSLSIHRPTDFRICVSQFSEKGHKSNFVIQPFSIFLIRNPEHVKTPIRLESLHKDDIVSYTGPPQKKKVLSLYVNSLDPGLYIILVATSLSGMEGHFTISLLSNYRTDFDSLWPPHWLLNKEEMPTDAAKSRSFAGSKGPAAKSKASGSSFFGSKVRTLFGGDDGDDQEEEEDG